MSQSPRLLGQRQCTGQERSAGRRSAFIVALAASLLAGLVLAPASGRAATETFAPIADTYSRSDMPSTNFGSSVRFSAQAKSPTRRAYLRFEVKLPAGSAVTKATLRTKSVSSAFGTGVDLHGVTSNSWNEGTLTYSNAPAHGPSVSYAHDYDTGAWVGFNATPLVTGPGLVSMALTTWSSAYHGFESRESDYDPQLVVEYAPPAEPPPPPAGALHSTPAEPFVDANGDPVRLHGFNLQPVWSDSPGQTWEQSRYQQIRDKGFNAARFVLKWDDFEPSRGSFNQTHLQTLDTAVARAKAAGLYIVLDMIHLWGSDGMTDVPAWAKVGDSIDTVQTNGTGYLKMLAERYREEPRVAAYDLVSEFHRWPIRQDDVLRAYDHMIREVRTVDRHKIVVIEPTYGNTSVAGSLADFSNLADKQNVVWSIHDYFAGGDDDGYNADGSQAGTHVWDGTTGYPSPDPQQLENHLRVHVDKMQLVGLPIWIGEFGIGDGVTNHDQWIKDKVALYKKYGLAYGWWEYYTSGPFSAVSTSTFSWKPWVDLLVPEASEPPPPDTGDTTPPETTIDSGPAEGSTSSSGSASFGFSSSESGSMFECRLDGAALAGCSSPKEYTGLADGSHTFEVRATDAAGNVDETPAKRTWTVAADPVIAAAGDVACDPASASFNGGWGTSTNCRHRYTADAAERINPEKVLMLGDAQYEYGTLSNFSKSYDPTWGRFKTKTLATAGTSHDYYGGGDFFSYYGLTGMPRGAYRPYSVDIGGWHIISMNSGCENSNVGGCSTSSSQYAWLKADLEQNTRSCILAMWHRPYWTSGYRHDNYTTTRPLMDLLHAHRADLLLTGHEHAYERLKPMRPDGTRDEATGITSFVVGTGGKSLESGWGTIEPNSAARQRDTYGVLKLDLRPGRFDFEFVPEAGRTYADSGTGHCH